MSTRDKACSSLAISKRTLRRYLREFAGLIPAHDTLSTLDLQLLKVVHDCKRDGRLTGQALKDKLVQIIQAHTPDSEAQDMGVATCGHPPVSGQPQDGSTGHSEPVPCPRVSALVLLDHLAATRASLDLLTKTVHILQAEVTNLRRLIAQGAQSKAELPAVTTPVPRPYPLDGLSWWRRLWLEFWDPAQLRVNPERSYL